ncbi:MAG: ATP-binding protein [Deltaproteobacteria bacterium]|nr:ATP-binding protein [Deltaproteobacteria bacterium]
MDVSRYLEEIVEKNIHRKMVFVSGPRQCGKTTLAQRLLSKNQKMGELGTYLNWDVTEHRNQILGEKFPAGKYMLVLDEIHKYSRWRSILKSLWDDPKRQQSVLVTGSAKLDFYRYGGDSLQGRYRMLRLHPFSVAELSRVLSKSPREVFENLFRFGGFPEPYVLASDHESRIWSREYRSRLVREELTSLESVSELALVERLALRLPDLVGNPLSINALREDLQVAHQTVSRWIDILERIYGLFRVYPFGGPRIRAVKKEAKHYHFDWNLVSDPGARLENLVACHLLKWCHFIQDSEGWDMELRYFRDTDKREVDFVVLRDGNPEMFVEVKMGEKKPSSHLKYLFQRFPKVHPVQVVNIPDCNLQTKEGIVIRDVASFLAELI